MRRPILQSRPAPALVLELTRRPLQLAKGRLCPLWPVPALRLVRQRRTRHPAAGPTVQLGAIAPAAAACLCKCFRPSAALTRPLGSHAKEMRIGTDMKVDPLD